GLFDPARKKPIPATPRHIGVITSPTGAAIHDILTVLKRRCPAIPITLYPTAVQGQAATADIVQAIDRVQRHGLADVLIVGRGGGSLEDLWCFNEEAVARAIAACSIPAVSAVGHEVDVTIADFVADMRAPTPSAAAEKISPDQQVGVQGVSEQHWRLTGAFRRHLRQLTTRLDQLAARLRDPRRELLEKAQRLDELDTRLAKAVQRRLEQDQLRTGHLVQRLRMQSPTRRLEAEQNSLTVLAERLQKAMHQYLGRLSDRLGHGGQSLHLVS